jgi:hypothetical protein
MAYNSSSWQHTCSQNLCWRAHGNTRQGNNCMKFSTSWVDAVACAANQSSNSNH